MALLVLTLMLQARRQLCGSFSVNAWHWPVSSGVLALAAWARCRGRPTVQQAALGVAGQQLQPALLGLCQAPLPHPQHGQQPVKQLALLAQGLEQGQLRLLLQRLPELACPNRAQCSQWALTRHSQLHVCLYVVVVLVMVPPLLLLQCLLAQPSQMA